MKALKRPGAIFLLLTAAIITGAALPAFSAGLPVFDALLYKSKPELGQYGLKHIRVVYDGELWNKGEKQDEPNVIKIIKVARGLPPGSLVCIDIENWPVTGPGDRVLRSIDKYKKVAGLFKQNNPALKIGFYGVLPINDYWRAVGARGPRGLNQWRQENKVLQQLVHYVDVIFPSLYTFYPDEKGWETYARENLNEARKYGKPVYAFLWPMYHDSNVLYRGHYLPVYFWRSELETCCKYADGIVIWGGWQEWWDENAPWWGETKMFLEKIRKK